MENFNSQDIRNAASDLGMTFNELADRIGCSRRTMRRYLDDNPDYPVPEHVALAIQRVADRWRPIALDPPPVGENIVFGRWSPGVMLSGPVFQQAFGWIDPGEKAEVVIIGGQWEPEFWRYPFEEPERGSE